MYLIDFKKGVEFKTYATHRLPHARVVAIESEREFGLSVLQRLDGDLKRPRRAVPRRRRARPRRLPRRRRPDETMPRILLIVDEFQEFFVEDDKLAQEAALLLDRLVRQGRAFGIHVLLGSQTLGGAYSLARSTIDQMAVRIALQCCEADAQLILSKDNTAARLLVAARRGDLQRPERPGRRQQPVPGRVARRGEARAAAATSCASGPADEVAAAARVRGQRARRPGERTALLAQLLDAPAAGEGAGRVARRPGRDQGPDRGRVPPAGGVEPADHRPARGGRPRAVRRRRCVGLAAQLPADGGTARSPSSTARRTTRRTPTTCAKLAREAAGRGRAGPRPDCPPRSPNSPPRSTAGRRARSADRSPRFLFVFGLHRFRDLRKAEDDFGFGRRGGEREPSPGEQFAAILRDGPPRGHSRRRRGATR